MATNFLYPSYAGRIGEREPELAPGSSASAPWTAERACCCPAKPAVMALMPAGPQRAHQTDLLFCAHHYRAARMSLAAAGATVVGQSGYVLGTTDVWPVTAGC